MGERSKIAWTDHTFNPWWGCSKISAGCQNCYAEAFAKRYGDWFGPGKKRRLFKATHWNVVQKWNARAEQARVREIGAGKKKRGKTLWEKARWGSMKLERSYSGLVLAWLAGYRACQRYAKRERSKKV